MNIIILTTIIFLLFSLITFFKVCLSLNISIIYQQLQIIYITISGIVIILYCNYFNIFPFIKYITELVNPQPGHGILNSLYIKQILIFIKYAKYIIYNKRILNNIYLSIFIKLFLIFMLHNHTYF